MPLYAGAAEADITPPVGVWMCGYAFRPTGCTAIHDPLAARALVLNDGSRTVALLAMDLLGLDFDLVERVKRGIAAEIGTEPAAVLLNATHTHGGPNVGKLNAMGERDPVYIEELAGKLVDAAKQAAKRMRTASLAYGRAPAQIGVNRRQIDAASGQSVIGHNPTGPVVPHVDTLSVLDSHGDPFAILFMHACHPTTLGGDNLQITADYCGYACDFVRAESGGAMPFFLQGCAGNINPMPRGTFEDAARHGHALGAAAVQALREARPIEGTDLRFEVATVDLTLKPPPPLPQCEAVVAELQAKLEQERKEADQGRIMHAEGLLRYAEFEREVAGQKLPNLTQPFTIQFLDLCGARFLGMPAEMFVQYALDFDRQSPEPLFPLGYTNGVHGYVPTAADYPFGGYEVNGAHRYYGTLMFTDECERLIRQTAYKLLHIEDPSWKPYSVEGEETARMA